jgi:hypothetical protein
VKRRIEGILDGSRQPPDNGISAVPGLNLDVPSVPVSTAVVSSVSGDNGAMNLISGLSSDGNTELGEQLEPGEEPPMDEAQLNELFITTEVAKFKLKQQSRDKYANSPYIIVFLTLFLRKIINFYFFIVSLEK